MCILNRNYLKIGRSLFTMFNYEKKLHHSNCKFFLVSWLYLCLCKDVKTMGTCWYCCRLGTFRFLFASCIQTFPASLGACIVALGCHYQFSLFCYESESFGKSVSLVAGGYQLLSSPVKPLKNYCNSVFIVFPAEVPSC